eukprot:67003_1
MSHLKHSAKQPNITKQLNTRDEYLLLVFGYNRQYHDKINPLPYPLLDVICQYLITKKECLTKVCFVGDNGVGKSSIIERYIHDEFKDILMTIGADFNVKTQDINDIIALKYQIWDHTGQEKFRSVSPMRYRGVFGIFMVYDITIRETFTHVQYWLNEINKYALPNVVIALVGNKIDLECKRQVTINEGQQYAKENDLMFMETSAKTNENIKQIFLMVGTEIVERFELQFQDANQAIRNTYQKEKSAKSIMTNNGIVNTCVLL